MGFAATMLVLARIGYWRMFSIFATYDDEGCLLITVRSFLEGHALYDDVFSMYGPVPVLVKSALFTAIGHPVGHDLARLFSLAWWLTTAALSGVIAWRLTRSTVAAWAGMVLVFHVLSLTIFEPGHPQELCALLLASIIVLATLFSAPRDRRTAPIAAAIGIAAGCVVMSKINMSVFLLLALAATALVFTARTRLVGALIAVFIAILLAAPAVLMHARLETSHVRQFAAFVTVALIPPILLGFGRRWRPDVGANHSLGFAAGLAAAVGLIAAILLTHGTTPHGLIDGVLLHPLAVGTNFAMAHDDGRWPVAIAFCAAALLWLRLERTGRSASPIAVLGAAVLRIGYAVYVLGWRPLEIVPYADFFALAVPAAMLILLPRVGREPRSGERIARVLLAFLSVTESLTAYPVSGSQRAAATFLSALLLVVAAADACHDLAWLGRRWAWWPTSVVPRFVQVAVVAVVLPMLWRETIAAQARYDGGTSLGLPGAEAIHIDGNSVAFYQRVSAALRDAPDSFFTFPGMNSFYFWTGRPPPTTRNMSNWMYMLDPDDQERIVAQLAAHPQLRVLCNQSLIKFWMQGSPVPPTPLVRYITGEFVPEIDLGDAAIWARRSVPPS